MTKPEIKFQKEKWQRYHVELQRMLNELDIMGIGSEASLDEYDGINGRLLGMLMDKRTRLELVEMVEKEAKEYHGTQMPTESIHEFVDRVLDWWTNDQ